MPRKYGPEYDDDKPLPVSLVQEDKHSDWLSSIEDKIKSNAQWKIISATTIICVLILATYQFLKEQGIPTVITLITSILAVPTLISIQKNRLSILLEILLVILVISITVSTIWHPSISVHIFTPISPLPKVR